MLKAILIILVVLVVLVVLDFVLASFRPGLQGIPFTVVLLMILDTRKIIRKRRVKVDHDMSAEELLSLNKKKDPLFNRKGNIRRIYNDTFDTFYMYSVMQPGLAFMDQAASQVLLPRPAQAYSDKPESCFVLASKYFELERISARGAIKEISNAVWVSKLQMNEELTCDGVIYNDLRREVTFRYLGSETKPVHEVTFTVKQRSFIVVEVGSIVSLIGMEDVSEREAAEQAMIERLSPYACGIFSKLKSVSIGDKSAERQFLLLCTSGLAGIACHEAVKALGKPQEIVDVKDGRRVYTGDAVKEYLVENQYSIAELSKEVLRLSKREISIIISDMIENPGHEGDYMGEMDFDDLYRRSKEIWDGLFDTMSTVYCKSPDEWPVFYALVLQMAVKEAVPTIPEYSAYKIAVGVASALSGMDGV